MRNTTNQYDLTPNKQHNRGSTPQKKKKQPDKGQKGGSNVGLCLIYTLASVVINFYRPSIVSKIRNNYQKSNKLKYKKVSGINKNSTNIEIRQGKKPKNKNCNILTKICNNNRNPPKISDTGKKIIFNSKYDPNKN